MRAPALATALAMSNATSPPRPPRRACSRPGSIRPRHIAANGDHLAPRPDSSGGSPPARRSQSPAPRGIAAAPPAPSEPVVDILHGVRVADPYRNLENLKSPSTRAWLKVKGEEAAALLARIDGHDAMTKRIAELAAASGDAVYGVVRMPGSRVFFMRRKSGETQFKLVMRSGAAGAERVLVDPETLSRSDGVPRAINYFRPSWDGKRVAYGISAGGSENASLEVIESDTGRRLGAPIPRVHRAATSTGRPTTATSLITSCASSRPERPRPRPFSTRQSGCSSPVAPAPRRRRCSARWSTRRSGSSASTSRR